MNTATELRKREASGGRWRGRLLTGGLLLGGVAVVTLIASMPSQKAPVPTVERAPVNVKVERVEPIAEISDSFEITAVVHPYTVVRVSAEVPGRIERYGTRSAAVRWLGSVLPAGSTIDEGQPVTVGDPLVLLNRDLLQARFDRARAQHEFDRQELQRFQSLYDRENASPTELRLVRTRHDVSKADLEEAARSLARATIAAPINGILNDWYMDPGEYAGPGDAVAEIVDIEKVKVCADVPERDVGYLRVGQTAEVFPSPRDTASLKGTITYINALADEITRSTRIEVTVENRVIEAAASVSSRPADGEYHLRCGQIVNLRLTRRTLRNVTMVPLASVIPLEEGKEVYVVASGKAERRRVELGFIRGRSIQVTSGLQPGDLLILEGHRLVSPGQPVNVVTSDARAPAEARAGGPTTQPVSPEPRGPAGPDKPFRLAAENAP